jgi:hypothetical protein
MQFTEQQVNKAYFEAERAFEATGDSTPIFTDLFQIICDGPRKDRNEIAKAVTMGLANCVKTIRSLKRQLDSATPDQSAEIERLRAELADQKRQTEYARTRAKLEQFDHIKVEETVNGEPWLNTILLRAMQRWMEELIDYAEGAESAIAHARSDIAEVTAERDALKARVEELEQANAELESHIVRNPDGSIWSCNCHFCQGHGDWCACGCGADEYCHTCNENPCRCHEDEPTQEELDAVYEGVKNGTVEVVDTDGIPIAVKIPEPEYDEDVKEHIVVPVPPEEEVGEDEDTHAPIPALAQEVFDELKGAAPVYGGCDVPDQKPKTKEDQLNEVLAELGLPGHFERDKWCQRKYVWVIDEYARSIDRWGYEPIIQDLRNGFLTVDRTQHFHPVTHKRLEEPVPEPEQDYETLKHENARLHDQLRLMSERCKRKDEQLDEKNRLLDEKNALIAELRAKLEQYEGLAV